MTTNRQLARLLGETHYIGNTCSLGHTLRYVGSAACVACARVYDKAAKAANVVSERARRKAWKTAHPDQVSAERLRYRQRNKDRIAAAVKARLDADPLIVAARQERTRAARIRAIANHVLNYARQQEREARQSASVMRERQLQLWRNSKNKRRARKRGADHPATSEQVRRLTELTSGCAYCGMNQAMHLDHKTAISRGGHHTILNLQFLCVYHNQHKRLTPDAFYRAAHGIPAITQWDVLEFRLADL